MNINILSKDYPVTKAMEKEIKDKLTFVRNFTQETINLALAKEGDFHKITFRTIYKDKDIIVNAENPDMYVGLTELVEKVHLYLNKVKDKDVSKMKKQRQDLIDKELGLDRNKEDRSIIKRKTFHLKPMLEEEAILQMQMIGHDFFVFLNAETDQVNVLYERKDNQYGLINTELM